jgi:hypothetical protein
MIEIWKEIEDYPNYMVSNEGRVKNIKTNKLLKPRFNDRGYISVVLYNNGSNHTFRINRLVAMAFIPNPENKPEIDHIDTNPLNNMVENLRWVTHKENMNNPLTRFKLKNNNGWRKGLEKAKIKRWENHKKQPPKDKNKDIKRPYQNISVLQFTKEGKFIKKWDSITAAQIGTQQKSCGNIQTCCNNKRKTAGGYIWMYAKIGAFEIDINKLKKVA